MPGLCAWVRDYFIYFIPFSNLLCRQPPRVDFADIHTFKSVMVVDASFDCAAAGHRLKLARDASSTRGWYLGCNLIFIAFDADIILIAGTLRRISPPLYFYTSEISKSSLAILDDRWNWYARSASRLSLLSLFRAPYEKSPQHLPYGLYITHSYIFNGPVIISPTWNIL